jgi:glutathione peroxidase
MRDNLDFPYSSIYDLSMKDIDGEMVSFDQFRGKTLLIVNVACKCQLAGPNFDQLIELDAQYRSKGLVILGFPCNQFFWREYGSSREIKEYITKKGILFRMFDKVDVNGSNTCDLYKYLRKNSELKSTKIGLNFGKFLVDKNGLVYRYYGPLTKPMEFLDDIKKLL